MRLWHYKLIRNLPRAQLLGQHRECCALRGKGWGKKHSTVDYVFEHPYIMLFDYHKKVIAEMERRGHKVYAAWKDPHYRGTQLGVVDNLPNENKLRHPVYPEHTNKYLSECIENILEKQSRGLS